MESLSTQLATLNKEHLALEEKLGAAELAMLNSKDERVTSLQDKCDELAAQCREAESRCHAAEGSLRTAEQAAASTEARLQVTNHDSRTIEFDVHCCLFKMRSRVWRQNVQILSAQDIVLSCWLCVAADGAGSERAAADDGAE